MLYQQVFHAKEAASRAAIRVPLAQPLTRRCLPIIMVQRVAQAATADGATLGRPVAPGTPSETPTGSTGRDRTRRGVRPGAEGPRRKRRKEASATERPRRRSGSTARCGGAAREHAEPDVGADGSGNRRREWCPGPRRRPRDPAPVVTPYSVGDAVLEGQEVARAGRTKPGRAIRQSAQAPTAPPSETQSWEDNLLRERGSVKCL